MLVEQSNKIGNAIGEETDLAVLVAQEISAMDSAIDEVGTLSELKGISWITIAYLIWRLITRGEQALFNLEIKKKSGSSINPDIHHSKVPSSDEGYPILKFTAQLRSD